MAFETGSAIDMDDLIAKISTFATANGWTEDRRDNVNGIFGLSKNSMFISFRWDDTDPDVLSIHQATAVLPASGTEPGDVTGDSGNGYNTSTSHTNANLRDERSVEIGGGPYPSYHIFEQDSGPAYLHIVVESTTDVFHHFGVGELNKVGDGWTGGEYVYGQRHVITTHSSTTSTWLLDGFLSSQSGEDERYSATIRMTGLPSQPAGSVYGNVWGNRTATPPTDSAANPKAFIQGGYRAGPLTGPWGLFTGSKTTGYIPMYSIAAFYGDTVNSFAYLMGWMPDVRGVAVQSFAPKDEVTIGADDWVLFPAQQRDSAPTSTTTGFMGIAYKKVTA